MEEHIGLWGQGFLQNPIHGGFSYRNHINTIRLDFREEMANFGISSSHQSEYLPLTSAKLTIIEYSSITNQLSQC